MCATLKGGEPWSALVKNRRKNGDHYWVRANATPVVRNGRPVGYMSVRTKASQLGLMFRWLIDDVSEQVINVQRAINEIAQGNDDLSNRTEQRCLST